MNEVFAAGYQEGETATRLYYQSHLHNILQEINQQILEFNTKQKQIEENLLTEIVALTKLILQKVYPMLEMQTVSISQFLQQGLAKFSDQKHEMVLSLHPDFYQFAKQMDLKVFPDPNLQRFQWHIKGQDGGVFYHPEKLKQEIFDLLEIYGDNNE